MTSMMHANYRPCEQWKKSGLALSTTSDEAAKLFDAALTQYVGLYEDTNLGGLEKTAEKLLVADTEFVMGRVLVSGLTLMGTAASPRLDKQLQRDVDEMVRLATTSRDITTREKQHAEAMKLFSDGYMNEATLVWEDILTNHPTDMLALKLAHDSYFYLAKQAQMRDSIARVYPHWNASIPLYGYLPGMYAFGLCETDHWAEAEKTAKKGLELIPKDGWATHALAHVYEMQGRSQEGISFLSRTLDNWTTASMLACHNFWHWAVYHIERGEHTAALDVFDSQIASRVRTSGTMLDIVDACSMLYRLEIEGVRVGQERWEDVAEICRPHADDHMLVFNDCHLLMSFLGAKKSGYVERLMSSVRTFIEEGAGTQCKLFQAVGQAMLRGMVACDEGRYSEAVNILNPHRYSVIDIGGSNAQRDVFNQLLIHAAMKSDHSEHQRLARSLLIERKAYKPDSPMTDRLMARAMASHAE